MPLTKKSASLLSMAAFIALSSNLFAMGSSPSETPASDAAAPATTTETSASQTSTAADLKTLPDFLKTSIKKQLGAKGTIDAINAEGKNANLPSGLQVVKLGTDKPRSIDATHYAVLCDFKYIDAAKKTKTVYRLEFFTSSVNGQWSIDKAVLK